MKKVKITTIILAIILVSLVAFGGVYIKTQNRMEDKVKEYSFGRELNGGRIIELKVKEESDEEEETTTQNSDDLTVENYETVKNTIEKRLKSLSAQDYTISLNKKDGTIRVELPEDERTDDLAYYLVASGKVELKEKDTSTELLNESMVKKVQYTYKTNTDGAYQVYLEILLTKDGQSKIEEIKNDYALLATEIEEIEKKDKSTTDSTEDTTTTEETDTTTENTDGTDENKEETKKVAKLSLAGTEYDIESLEKNKITVKIGSETSNNTSVNNNIAKAAEIVMLVNSGKYPIEYEAKTNKLVYSDISKEQLIYFALIIAILLVVVFIVFTVKYKTKGLLSSISCVGFIAILSLLLRYTNVNISIEGIGAIILTILIDLKLNQIMLNKMKTMNVVNEATVSSYKEIFSKLIPIMIITLVFCFSGWANLSSFGMIMFWGLILVAVYNVIFTKTLLKLKESK